MITDLVWKSLEKGGNHWHFKGLVFRSVHDYFIANSSFCIWILSWNYYHYLRKRLPLTIQDIWEMKWMRESCWYSFWEAKSTLSCSKSVCRGCSVVQLLIVYLIKEIRTKKLISFFLFRSCVVLDLWLNFCLPLKVLCRALGAMERLRAATVWCCVEPSLRVTGVKLPADLLSAHRQTDRRQLQHLRGLTLCPALTLLLLL